ncbi:MAG: hypothetical protein Q9M32_02355 [Sulfurimonas sp.]|nr:hypothetical protein [Sulfurimonas sp.]MDQ7061440.1 hypothetical protein [Sulfurimonas sp.]
MDDKGELLEEIGEVLDPQKLLSFVFYLYIMLLLILVSIFAFPKIYIQQQIYFKSREISRLQSEYDTLKEENRLIRASVERIKFKNQILDTLF